MQHQTDRLVETPVMRVRMAQEIFLEDFGMGFFGEGIFFWHVHGNLRVPAQSHPPKKQGPNKAIFPGGDGIGGVPLESHGVCSF